MPYRLSFTSHLSVGEILNGAANLLERAGWIQGNYVRRVEVRKVVMPESIWIFEQNTSKVSESIIYTTQALRTKGFCAVGAMNETSKGLGLEAVNWLSKYMTDHGYSNKEEFPLNSGAVITMWNDDKKREKFEVVDLLRLAAKEWYNENEPDKSDSLDRRELLR